MSAVAYLNTKPFLRGLEKTGFVNQVDLSLDIPSQTAAKLSNGLVDVALVPVAVLQKLNNYQIITDYCIGTQASVRTVALYSQVPLHQVKTVLLDYQSATSVQLVQILCREYWNIQPNFIPAQAGFEHDIKGYTAGLIIGDRTITWENEFNYVYDLGSAWIAYTKLPFVFAAWVAIKLMNKTFIQQLNKSFALGLKTVDEISALYQPQYQSNFNVKHYLTQNISYKFDDAKYKGLALFLKMVEKNECTPNINLV